MAEPEASLKSAPLETFEAQTLLSEPEQVSDTSSSSDGSDESGTDETLTFDEVFPQSDGLDFSLPGTSEMQKDEEDDYVGPPVGNGSGSTGGDYEGGYVGIPEGYQPYGDGSHYMYDEQGTLYLTPEYEQQVNSGEIDWWGVANDITWITGSTLAFVLSGPYRLAGGALADGLDTLHELNSQ